MSKTNNSGQSITLVLNYKGEAICGLLGDWGWGRTKDFANVQTGSGMAAEVDQQTGGRERVTAAEFRQVCGLFPTGVTVVTRVLANGRPYGMTVSSFTSVSLDPPLILVCIDNAANFLRDLSTREPFLVNVLGEDQQRIAKRFASRHEEDRFEGVVWKPDWKQLPLLPGAIASFACTLDRSIEAGDHHLLLGLVEQVRQHEGKPLVWCDRGYHCIPSLGAND